MFKGTSSNTHDHDDCYHNSVDTMITSQHINMRCISHLNTIKAINCNFHLSLEKLLCLYLHKVILVISMVKKHECSEAKNVFPFSITESATHDQLVWISIWHTIYKTSLVKAALGRSCSHPIIIF